MFKNKNFNIALYVRVSTEEQAETPEGSIKNQEQRLREAVVFRNKQSNFGQIFNVYVDAGISAKDMNRPKLQQMLNDMRANKINLIMVTEISRLSRNNRDFLEIWDLMSAQKCSFMSLREDFDTTTAAGEMLLFQLMNFAQFERKQTSERVAANILARAKRGLYNGGSIPLGYKKCLTKSGSLDIDEPHAATVRVAFEALLREGSLSRAARWLNDHGYKAKAHREGGGSHMRTGHFTVDNLQRMIRNKAYIGIKTYTHKGKTEETKANWDGIVDEKIFYRANEKLTANHSRLKPLKPQSRHPYLLSGVCFCMKCGNHMPGKSATGRKGKVPYYEHSWATKCQSTLTKKTFMCAPTRVSATKAEALVWAEFCRFIDSKMFLKELLAKVKALHSNNNESSERGKLKAKLYGLNSQLEALAERLSQIPASVPAAPIFKQMEKIEAVKKEVEEGLLKLKDLNLDDRLVPVSTFEQFAKFTTNTLKNNPDFNIRRALLQKFISRVEIGEDTVKIYWNLDKDSYDQELKTKNPEQNRGFSKNYINGGSHSLTFGARGET